MPFVPFCDLRNNHLHEIQWIMVPSICNGKVYLLRYSVAAGLESLSAVVQPSISSDSHSSHNDDQTLVYAIVGAT